MLRYLHLTTFWDNSVPARPEKFSPSPTAALHASVTSLPHASLSLVRRIGGRVAELRYLGGGRALGGIRGVDFSLAQLQLLYD